jgi:hypothetical protein
MTEPSPFEELLRREVEDLRLHVRLAADAIKALGLADRDIRLAALVEVADEEPWLRPRDTGEEFPCPFDCGHAPYRSAAARDRHVEYKHGGVT